MQMLNQFLMITGIAYKNKIHRDEHILLKDLFWEQDEIKNPRILGELNEDIVPGCEKMLKYKNQED